MTLGLDKEASGSLVELNKEELRRESRRKSSLRAELQAILKDSEMVRQDEERKSKKSSSTPFPPTTTDEKRKSIQEKLKKTQSFSKFEDTKRNSKRGSDYFGTAENSLLFGSSSSRLARMMQDNPLDAKPSEDQLEERHSFIMLDDSTAGSRDASQKGSHHSQFISEAPSRLSMSTTKDKMSMHSRASFRRHNLKARPSDLLYLRNRILFHGIFEEDSEEEPDKAVLVNRRRRSYKRGESDIVLRLSQTVTSPKFKRTAADDLDYDSEGCNTRSSSEISVQEQQPDLRPSMHKSIVGSVGSNASDKLKSRHVDAHGRMTRKKQSKHKSQAVCQKKTVPILAEADEQKSKVGSIATSEQTSSIGPIQTQLRLDEDDSDLTPEELATRLLERICMLREESKRPLTLKERYLGHKQIPGFPYCIDRTEGYPECLPPGELIRQAVSPQKLWGIPENIPLTRDQFISLLRSMEGVERNDYIDLVYTLPETHPEFNPYRFKIVHYTQVNPKTGYYTVSKYGVLHIRDEYAEFTSMVHFQTQMLIYDYIIRIPFFIKFRLWKLFTMWRSKVYDRKMALLALQEALQAQHEQAALALAAAEAAATEADHPSQSPSEQMGIGR